MIKIMEISNQISKDVSTNALYGLRFVMISLLIIYHMGYPIATGGLSVSFFLVLSGFVIGYGNQKRQIIFNRKNIIAFYKRRFERIYPLYFLTSSCGFIVMYYYKIGIELIDLLLQLFMIKTWFPFHIEKVFYCGGPIWYVSTLWFCYLITPIIYWGGAYLKRKFNSINSLPIVALVMYTVYYAVLLSQKEVIISYSIEWWLLYLSPLRGIDYAIGMLCGIYYADKKKRIWKNKNAQYFLFTLLEVISISIIVEILRYKISFQSSLSIDACWIGPCVVLILVFSEGKGLFSKILSNKLLIYLGKMNYPMLCCHQILFQFIIWLLGGQCMYSKDIGGFNYARSFFLFILIICVSDILNRTICKWKLKCLSGFRE